MLQLAGVRATWALARTSRAAHEPSAVRLLPLQQRLDAGARHGQVAQQCCVHGRPAQRHGRLSPLALITPTHTPAERPAAVPHCRSAAEFPHACMLIVER
jgi:hypothetical protein